MYKVLIVDDEVLVRVGLKTTIDWEAIGFTIVSEAGNGEQGYINYQKYQPDVIITDIRMPKQDGIWLVEKIKKENQAAKILVLTCYDEFSYARKALKAGADDYILKSEIEDEELIRLMCSIKDKLDLQKDSKTEKGSGSPNLDDLKRSVILSIIERRFRADEDTIKLLKELNFPVSNACFVFLGISLGYQDELQTDKAQVASAVMNILRDQFDQESIAYLYGFYSGIYYYFIALPNLNAFALTKLLNYTGNASVQYFNVLLHAVCSERFYRIEQADTIHIAFIEQAQILFYQTKEQSIVQTDAIHFSEPDVFELKNKYHKDLIEAIGHENIERAGKLIDEIGQCFERNLVYPAIVRIFFSNLVGDLYGSYGMYLSNSDVFDTYKTYYQRIEKSEHMADLIQLVSVLTSSLIAEIRRLRNTSSRSMINQALNYIKYHFAEKISLDDVAKEVNMSKHYLCSVFKKETGENMSLYINKLRIERAKQILLESDAKIKEIFEKVGYTDQQYFSKVFKKITGMTVLEFKESKASLRHGPVDRK